VHHDLGHVCARDHGQLFGCLRIHRVFGGAQGRARSGVAKHADLFRELFHVDREIHDQRGLWNVLAYVLYALDRGNELSAHARIQRGYVARRFRHERLQVLLRDPLRERRQDRGQRRLRTGRVRDRRRFRFRHFVRHRGHAGPDPQRLGPGRRNKGRHVLALGRDGDAVDVRALLQARPGTAAHFLRPDSAHWKPVRMFADYDGAWTLPLRTYIHR
jgi:hypothetical protein